VQDLGIALILSGDRLCQMRDFVGQRWNGRYRYCEAVFEGIEARLSLARSGVWAGAALRIGAVGSRLSDDPSIAHDIERAMP
jgi:hypothetical protein